jgi:hypothetical protein
MSVIDVALVVDLALLLVIAGMLWRGIRRGRRRRE